MVINRNIDPKRAIIILLLIVVAVLAYFKRGGNVFLTPTRYDQQQQSEVYSFENVYATSSNGKAVVKGRVSSRVISADTTITVYIMDEEGRVLHTVRKSVGILSPLKPYDFEININSSTFSQQVFNGHYQVRVQGHTISHG